MDTNKMREQFEAWVKSKWPNQQFGRFSDGEYQSHTLHHAWLSWQASREAVVVELPAKGKPDADDVAGWCLTRNSTIDACRRVIEAQGLKVAP